jgi:hypothetical protein
VLEIRRVRTEEWRALRDLRLEALQDSPEAFWARYEEALERTDDEWREWTTYARLSRPPAGRAARAGYDDPRALGLLLELLLE